VSKLSSSAAIVPEQTEASEPAPPSRLALVPSNGGTPEKIRWTLQQGFTRRIDGGSDSIVSRRELSALRGRVFYAEGRRPQFLGPDGEFADEDEHDSAAFHLIGSSGSERIAACRLVRFQDVATTDFERRVGPEAVEKLLAASQVGRGEVVEVSRWVVDARFREEGLGAQLIAGLWALALNVGVVMALAWAGTRDGQARALTAMGGSPISGVARIKSEAWDDELQALSFDPRYPARRFRPWVDRMSERLGFGEVSWAR
jgi:hypothetical protein